MRHTSCGLWHGVTASGMVSFVSIVIFTSKITNPFLELICCIIVSLNLNFELDLKNNQSWFFYSNLKVVFSVWPQNYRMSAWLVTSQSAPKDGVLLCEVSHHRPSNKLTSPNQPSLNLNKKITAKILIKRTSLLKRCTV